MNDSIFLTLGLQVLLILLNAIFACVEIAVISMNDNKLAKMAAEGNKKAVKLAKLTEKPARFLSTIQVGITLAGFLGSAFAAENFSDSLAEWFYKIGVPLSMEALDTISLILITVVLSYFTLVFGELVPKQIAMRKAEALALGMSGLITFISKLCAPLVFLLTVSTNGVLRLMGIDPNAQDDSVSEEEIRMMVDVGSEKGTIDDEERDFIQNVFEFDNLAIEEIITHRTDVTMLDTEDSLKSWDETINSTRYTYYPVCEGSPDQIVGVLNSKIYFRLKDKSRDSIMENAVSPVYFVPETLMADTLFRNMKKEKVHFAVVLDEYGGMSGIITIKDLIEELVGDLEDDVVEEKEDDLIQQLSEDCWRVEGGVLLEELSENIGIEISCEDYDTVNGMIFHALGSLPELNEEIEIGRLKIKVEEIANYQVKTAIINLLPPQEENEEEE